MVATRNLYVNLITVTNEGTAIRTLSLLRKKTEKSLKNLLWVLTLTDSAELLSYKTRITIKRR